MTPDEQSKIAQFKTSMDAATAAAAAVVRRSTPEKVLWLAQQGIPLGVSFLPPGVAVGPTPRALPITMTVLGTVLGALTSPITTKQAHAIALDVLLQGVPSPASAAAYPDADVPLMDACCEHLRCCYQRLRTMVADDHVIEVVLEVVMAMFVEMRPALEGS